MGRTLPSITQAFLNEQASLARFRRALRREDQQALDALLVASRHHLAAAAYASHLLPFETMLLAMLLEEHKHVLRLGRELEALKAALGEEAEPGPAVPPRIAPPAQDDAAAERRTGAAGGASGDGQAEDA
jgi:hypothetical protein